MRRCGRDSALLVSPRGCLLGVRRTKLISGRWEIWTIWGRTNKVRLIKGRPRWMLAKKSHARA